MLRIFANNVVKVTVKERVAKIKIKFRMCVVPYLNKLGYQGQAILVWFVDG